jgi:minichromosome maintenance protein 10
MIGICRSRQLPYEDLQAYMTGRYYISPSRLYSVVRAQPGGAGGARGQAYDVPVVGDWVTIAVVAGRSPVRISRAPVAVGPGEARDADDPDPTPTSSATRNPKSAGRNDPEPPPIGGRKYVNMTLIDFGAGGGGGSTSSTSSKKGTSRGDAVLSLLLFESDTYDTVSRGDGLLPEKKYKGGSRGAFEAMAKLREGSVIALLNPRVLKPLQVSDIFAWFSPGRY